MHFAIELNARVALAVMIRNMRTQICLKNRITVVEIKLVPDFWSR